MATPMPSFTDLVLSQCQDPSSSAKTALAVNGRSLTIADVVAVSRQLTNVELTPESIDAINVCSKIIPEKIAKGDIIYGVNTGFGGSADTRSSDVEKVQQSLISHLTCGILADGKQEPVVNSDRHTSQSNGNPPSQSNGVANPVQSNGVGDPVQSNGVVDPIQSNGVADPVQSNGVGDPIQSNAEAQSNQSNGNPPSQSNGVADPVQSNGVAEPIQSNGVADPIQSNGVVDPIQSNGHPPSQSNGVTHPVQSNGEAQSNQSNGHPPSIDDLKEQQRRRWVKSISLPLNDPLAATCMPESWARASMLIRLNSLAGGASGIRVDIADSLVHLLNKDVVPRIPVRGSISASGDLSALAWIGALMQGKPSATAFAGPRTVDGGRRVKRADVALKEAGIAPIRLHAKEGLAIVNGTAVSAGVAALAAHESIHLAALSQVLTAMSVEALRGSDESFEPFIARVRPHPGQVDSARNIKAFLRGSRLLNHHDSQNEATLRQDRYSLRTASQWIGPVLEDFSLAHEQITIELNSVTDNPLIDPTGAGRVLHGGNFQARAVTSAAEKLRQGLQGIGRMLFTQCTEMINPATSWGLPPNLCSDDPNSSFLFKGLDVVVAALTSELGFLANPVGSHVQTAEMGNQSLNSLALVSARYTLEAVDVLSQIASAHLLVLCQALDLRTIEIEGRNDAAPPNATPYIGQASRRMYHFIRNDLGIPFLGEEHLASTEAATIDGTTPSVGLYNTRVYESIRSGRLYEVVLASLKEVGSEGVTDYGIVTKGQ